MRKCLQECQQSYTSSEFLEAIAVMEMEWQERTLDQYMYAQIAFEVHRLWQSWVEDKKETKIEDFLLKFGEIEKIQKKKELDEEEIQKLKEQRSKASKSVWMGMLKKKPGKHSSKKPNTSGKPASMRE